MGCGQVLGGSLGVGGVIPRGVGAPQAPRIMGSSQGKVGRESRVLLPTSPQDTSTTPENPGSQHIWHTGPEVHGWSQGVLWAYGHKLTAQF